jgi:hypothetical protein
MGACISPSQRRRFLERGVLVLSRRQACGAGLAGIGMERDYSFASQNRLRLADGDSYGKANRYRTETEIEELVGKY